MDKILQMLQLQQQLNDATNGEGWENGTTKNGKIIDWRRCAFIECAELIDSYPWKHWKNINAEPNYANIKIEAVDIWHFIMSQGLEDYKLGNLGDIGQLAHDIEALPNHLEFQGEIVLTQKDTYAQIKTVETLIRVIMCTEKTEAMIIAFFEVAMQSGLNLDTLYKLYVGKNILNRFRQDKGYKNGTYIKEWHGEEDNVVMQRILDENDEITPEALYTALNLHYPLK